MSLLSLKALALLLRRLRVAANPQILVAARMFQIMLPSGLCRLQWRRACNTKKKTRSDITTHPGGPRPQRPYAQGRTHAKQVQVHANARTSKPRTSKPEPVRRRSSYARTEDQSGTRKRANIYTVGGWRVHTADETPSRNAAARSKH